MITPYVEPKVIWVNEYYGGYGAVFASEEDAKDEAEAKLQKTLEHLKFCLMRLDELVLESGRSIEYGEEDPFRMGEWFEPLELMAIEEARTVLADIKEN